MLKRLKSLFKRKKSNVEFDYFENFRVKDPWGLLTEVNTKNVELDKQYQHIYNTLKSDYENLPRRCRVRVKYWKNGDMV